eukprot:403339803
MVEMELLKDPLGDRIIRTVPLPPNKPLSAEHLYGGTDLPDWKLLLKYYVSGGRIDKMQKEPNIVKVPDPVIFVGDIHGQFYDLNKMLELVGKIGQINFVFLGDYVDRGMFSFEVISTLYAMKLNYPNHITLLRGNHECRQMTESFNFRVEVEEKFDQEVYDLLMESFDSLPIAALIDNKILAVHGGISPELVKFTLINKIDRFKEIPKVGLFTDLMWSDPVENETGYQDQDFKKNNKRNCSYLFGSSAANNFLENNNLLCVVRAHEVQMSGYKLHQWNGPAEFPAVITIFSAPNYCDVYNNKAAVLRFENNQIKIQQYNYTNHPFVLPDNMDVFTWSLPFVSEKVMEILFSILLKGARTYGLDTSEISSNVEVGKVDNLTKVNFTISKGGKFKPDVVKQKLGFISKVMRMQSNLRQNRELFVMLKGMCPDNKIPRGLLLASKEEIKDALEHFKKAKEEDSVNEMRPQ